MENPLSAAYLDSLLTDEMTIDIIVERLLAVLEPPENDEEEETERWDQCD